jgi:hypothetical protein
MNDGLGVIQSHSSTSTRSTSHDETHSCFGGQQVLV